MSHAEPGPGWPDTMRVEEVLRAVVDRLGLRGQPSFFDTTPLLVRTLHDHWYPPPWLNPEPHRPQDLHHL